MNGHEIEYDTFDLANMELYDSEVRRIEEEVKALIRNPLQGTTISVCCAGRQKAFWFL